MRTRPWKTALILVVLLAGCVASPPTPVRIALFNVRELSTEKIAEIDARGVGTNPQLRAAARIIQRVRPDILVLQEIDHDYDSGKPLAANARRFLAAYLETGAQPIHYPHVFAAPSNTGILSGRDLDDDGVIASDAERGTRAHGGDCYGFGTYPGQYSMAVLSRYPVVADEARSFRKLLWRELPGNHIPPGHFSDAALEVFRLSSKSHWDLPVEVASGRRVHLWVSHPTPPVFDGPEDRNGRRNHDEIKLWVEYLDRGETLTDDDGRSGGYDAGEPFVIVGDLNARPGSDATYDGVTAIGQLLDHPRIRNPEAHVGEATASFGGGVRVDYVLPSMEITLRSGGVFAPTADADSEGRTWADDASDHRLVWLDVVIE